jgi:Aspartyl protease
LPSIEGRHDRRRIIIPIAVLVSHNPHDLSFELFQALVDTGATASGLGPNVVDRLGLKSHGKRPLGSATEERQLPFYVFRLGLFDAGDTNKLPYIFGDLNGFGWPHRKDFDVILGMDVLSQCGLNMTSDARWSIRFGR